MGSQTLHLTALTQQGTQVSNPAMQNNAVSLIGAGTLHGAQHLHAIGDQAGAFGVLSGKLTQGHGHLSFVKIIRYSEFLY